MERFDDVIGKNKKISEYIFQRITDAEDVHKEKDKMLEEVGSLIQDVILTRAIVEILKNQWRKKK